MDKDIVFFDVETLNSELESEKFIEFAALRVRNGQIHESCRYLLQPDQGVIGKWHTDLQIEKLGNELPLSGDHQEIMNFLGDAVLVGHEISVCLSILERKLNVRFQQPLWDTLDLSKVFFPNMHHYQLSYLADKLSLPLKDETLHLTEEKAWLTWKLFEACWKKGMKFDLSFFDHAKGFMAEWVGKDFIEQLHKEIIRSFPDRPIRTDQVLTPFTDEGLFAAEKIATSIPESIDWVVDNFSPGGNLEQNLPSYESRSGQVKMARLIAKGLSSSQHVVVEAGTGTGKSFAYLIPSLWSAKKTGQKVVVATHTIPLQEQLQKKDIPILEAVLPFSFRTSVLKGKSNYCCLKKWQGCLVNREILGNQQKLAVLSILVWLRETLTGDIQELSKVPGLMELWPNISADNETCIPGRCSKAGVCFLLRARKKAEESDVLIVNHSLLFSDLKTDYNVLPEYHQLVIDEAHQIYQTALQHLGSELSVENVTRIIDNIYRPTGINFYGTVKQRLQSLASSVPSVPWEIFTKRLEGIPETCASVLEQMKELFELLSMILGMERTFRFVAQHTVKPWWAGLSVQIENLVGRLKGLLTVLESLTSVLSGDDADEIEELKYTLNSHQRDLQSFVDTLILAINVNNPKQVTWLEQSSRLYLKTSPIEVSEILREKIFLRLDSVILTSATLSISNSFEHFLQDIGLPNSTLTAQVDSPFDYERQMQFIVVKKGMNFQNTDGEKAIELAEFIAEVAGRMNGRTMVLFTAHSMLRQTYEYLSPLLAKDGIESLAQGIQGERSTLLEAFKRNPKSVLLGANSFWEGIDIPGDTLSCVILVKLPFWPPSLPLIEARSEYLKSQGRDPFHELLLPEAVIRFKQGFGRLIRSKGDRGVVILLDDRVIEKYYGRFFLGSLPIRTHIRGENALVFRKIEEYTRDLSEELL
ncbi:helicase C-terminal domain-containing protein [Desulfosporosinus sp.]|uniref:helicase C-terminal domain-containing protein n=1 Tax=Desulfosporosinus sp. TaxID=157907 RepID=UPI0023274170|nr:helicase C-terminal domain-containing protein [Desulfosporosinus sp.]MDA8220326.1 DEAD/DEAH box helicase [Desulfitobacterium hafniense]